MYLSNLNKALQRKRNLLFSKENECVFFVIGTKTAFLWPSSSKMHFASYDNKLFMLSPQPALTYTPISLKVYPPCSTPSLATCSSINLSDCTVDPVKGKFLAFQQYKTFSHSPDRVLCNNMCCACIIPEFLEQLQYLNCISHEN